MTTSQVTVKTLAVLALVVGVASAAQAQPGAVTVEWAFKQNPKQPGVNVSTPTPDQVPRCKVTPIANPKTPAQPMGYLVSDPDGKPVRQFVSYDNKNFNIVSFYLDGVEAYRETYPVEAGAPYQFRWLGPNGTKWGLDHNRTFTIDEWAVISPEEVSQEIMKALIANDPNRLKPLLITKEHLAAIGLPAADAERILTRTATAGKRLTDTAATLKLSDKVKWQHADYGVPQTRPADSFGNGQTDYTAYKSGTILVDDAGKPALFQTGELVQVGRAWKLVDGPTAGGAQLMGPGGPPLVEDAIKQFVDQLNELDKKGPAGQTMDAITAFNAKRAEVLELIVARAVASRETWVKMLLDSCAQAGEGGKPENVHIKRVRQWRDEMMKPGGNATIAAYAAFRLLVAENNLALRDAEAKDYAAIQEKWRSGLEQYMKDFANSADAPEAALRLAMAWELSGGKDATEAKANEGKARQWYEHLTKNFSTHTHATKAAGALKRLDSEGKPLELTGPLLAKPTEQFNAAQKDKVVVVYYWAGWNPPALADDAKKLRAIEKEYGPKGLVIVTVGLDHDAKAATDAVTAAGLPGTHLYLPGGLDNSPLAAAYGILAPPHILVAGKDGKITNRNSHLGSLEDEVKKLTAEK